MSYDPEDLAEAISDEIMRLSAKREARLRAAQSMGAVGENRPDLYLMDQAMHFARQARDHGEVAGMVMALKALKDFKA